MHELHQIATLGRGAVQVEHQLPPAAATGSQGLLGLQARRLQGVVHQIQHLLHVGPILATDLQPVVVLAPFATQPERQQAAAQSAQQG